MEDLSATRRNNLKHLIDTTFEGNKSLFSRVANANNSEISGLCLGSRPFGERKARKLEMDLQLPLGYFDGFDGFDGVHDDALKRLDEAVERAKLSTGRPKQERTESVTIDVYLNQELCDSYFTTPRDFALEFFRRTGRSPDYSYIYWQHDKSMDPTIGKECACLVDMSDKRIVDGAVYLINTQHGIIIRRILDDYATGGYVLRCDSRDTAKHPDRKLSDLKSIQVLGRVYWTERKL